VRPRVVIVQEAVLQYRARFFELLRDRLDREGVDLDLVHSNVPASADVAGDAVDLPWATRVDKRDVWLGGRRLVWQRAHHVARAGDLVIVEQASRHLLNYLLAGERALGRRRLALWGHGRNLRVTQASRSAEWVKRRLSRHVDWWFAYTELSADIVAALGFPRDRITVVQNAFDTRALAAAVDALDAAAVERLRAEWGIGDAPVGLYLGGLFVEKRLDLVRAAADEVRRRDGRFVLLVAGGGTERAAMDEFARTRPWVRCVGPRFGADKAALLALADVLVVPAEAGLVVLDALAGGVPIAISAHEVHNPEVAYLRDGVNSLIVDDGGDPRRYAAAVADLLADAPRRQALAAGCREERTRYTVEEMATRFADGILAALRS
jgi:L-malate glycosyltransferase